MSKSKTSINEHGSFEITRGSESKNFVCDRCFKPKIAKVSVEWKDKQNNVKIICNGCYGRLVSGIPL